MNKWNGLIQIDEYFFRIINSAGWEGMRWSNDAYL